MREDVFVFPMSFAQERLWFLAQLEPDSASYNLPAAVSLRGALDPALVERCALEIVRRHESLRTTFRLLDDQPVQLVHADWFPRVAQLNLSELPSSTRELELRQAIAREARRPFDLVHGPLLRISLFRLTPSEHVLLWVVHHSVFDGWSTNLVLQEFATLYAAFRAGESSPLPELPLQYADFADWQRKRVEAGALAAQLDYWRTRLAGDEVLLELPADRARPALQRFRGARHFFTLSAELTARLRALARAQGTTLYTLLVAVYKALLARYTGQRDIRVGTPVTNRSRAELEGIVGCFANTVVLRSDLAGDPSFLELLGRVKETVREAEMQREVPFDQVVEALRPVRDPSRAPLCQVLFALQPELRRAPEIAGLELCLLDLESGGAQLDLALELALERGGMSGALEYDTDLFDARTIERLAVHLLRLFESVVDNPSARLSRLAMLTPEERLQLLAWSQPASGPVSAPKVEDRAGARAGRAPHLLFEEHAARSPAATAVVQEGETISYGELDRRASELAWRLLRCGVGREVRVAIALPRSIEMVVAIFAVLKAGGAYVPLDPRLPAERIATMVRDAGIRVVLAEDDALEGVPADVTVLRAQAGSACGEGRALLPFPAREPAPEQAAYVLFTSGSTGVPKGVVVSQRAFASFIETAADLYEISAQDRVLQFAALSFDASVEEIFPCLARGATLVLRTEAMLESVATFLGACSDWEVTALELPTMYFHRVVAGLAEGLELPASFRLLLIGGEAALPGHVNIWRSLPATRRVRLLNTYGPAEATVTATASDLSVADVCDGWAVSIGRALANTRLYVLDGGGELLPSGAVGELYLGGDALARGYWARPALTAERFVPNPFAERPGERLYRTGDRVRFRADGQLEFLGRVDHQVKLRGFRIEPGEIEARLVAQPGVREAIVVLREEAPDQRRLVAYVAAGENVSAAELRTLLKAQLPDYMVPSAFVVLPELPHTAHGKIDRRALPAPPLDSGERVAPTSEVETILAQIWAELLGRPVVGIQENFFELGGESILALQVVARARARGLALTPRQLFQHQTVAALAAVAQPVCAVAAEGQLAGEVPLTPVQRWFFQQTLPNPHHWNQSVLLASRRPVAFSALESALAQVAERHDALRLRFAREGDTWTQRYLASGSTTPLARATRVDLSKLAPAEQIAAIARAGEAAQGRLHLDHGPLLEAVLFELGPAVAHGQTHADARDEPEPLRGPRLRAHDAQTLSGAARAGGLPGFRLLLTAHHLVVDGVSWRILLEDLETAYRQILAGEPVHLPAKTSSFGAWALGLAAHAQAESLALAAEDWLATNATGAAFPVDDPAGAELEGETVRFVQRIGGEATRALLRAPSAYRMRIDELLITALAAALARFTGQSSVLFELEGHGRDALADVDVSRTVGWFTCLYPVRLELAGVEQPGLALKAVKEQLREHAQRASSYGLLRYLSGDPRAELLRTQASPAVSFNYLGQWDDLLSEDALFSFAEEDFGPERDPQARRGYALEVDAAVVAGALRITWSFSGARHRPETIERLSEALAERLSALVAHCLDEHAGGVTPSDFPLARLDQAALDRLFGSAREVQDVYPLSSLQQGLLFHSLWEPGAGAYVEQVTCKLEGKLDLVAFERAWELTIARHDALRTTFVWEGADQPLQVVRRTGALELSIEDWQGLSAEQRAAERAARLSADRTRGFELSEGPLLRLAVFRLAEDAQLVLLSHHHLILDGWAAALVLRDAFAAYDAQRSGRSAALAPSRPYRDYIAWLRAQELAAAEAFFRRALAGFSAATELPFARLPHDAGQASDLESSGYEAQAVALPASLTARLEAFARRERLTLNTLVQAAWAFVLGRAARSDDVLFGITVAGRSAPLTGIEGMVGLFINTLPLRVALPASFTVSEWLRALAETTSELGRYEHTPLTDARAWSAVPSGQPLFESLLVFENYPADAQVREGLPGLGVCEVAFADQTNYPLTLSVLPGRELGLRLGYDRRRFDGRAAGQLLALVTGALRQLMQRCTARLGELSLLGELDAARVLGAGRGGAVSYPNAPFVHVAIERAAEQHPERVAVIFEQRRLSYRELNERANQVAHALRRRGVGPDVLVAIAAERSLELVIGLLGILKAGGAYVPIDPDYPPQRIAFMLEDAGASVLVSQWPVAARLPPQRAELLCLDADRAQIERESTANPELALLPDQLAYTIYTSGSTGTPKGAGNTHRGLFNRLQWMQQRFALEGTERVLQKTPFSFDVSVWEFFWPLMAGASLVVARPGDHRDSDRLWTLIRQHGVTTLHFVPPMLEAFLESGELVRSSSLRRVICSGEALSAELARRCFERIELELHNLYGPTEASIDVTAWACQTGDNSALLPIGSPIANTQVYVLDRHGHPLPQGVPGELYIGGSGLARGYHRRPGLTAERFVPDPFASAPGARLYRTGDLARLRSDGAIEFLGRLDHQIKIRGFRVELGEIEARLLQCSGVREAVVIARAEAHGGKRLIGYVSGSALPEPERLRAELEAALPAYMVPALIIAVPRLPLSPNGKVDRRALPAPDTAGAVTRPYVAPRSEAERILAEVWAEVLHLERVGIEDDFFELGGDSIVSLQVLARAAQRGLRLTPKLLFEHPTIAEAAARAELGAAQASAPSPTPEREAPAPHLSQEEWRDLLDELDR